MIITQWVPSEALSAGDKIILPTHKQPVTVLDVSKSGFVQISKTKAIKHKLYAVVVYRQTKNKLSAK